MPELIKHLDADAARDLVTAFHNRQDDIQAELEFIYGQIAETASQGGVEFHRLLANMNGGDGAKPNQPARIMLVLRSNGYIVDMDAGVLTVKWGRSV